MCERKMSCKTSGMSLHRNFQKLVHKYSWSPACFPNDGRLLINENNKSVQEAASLCYTLTYPRCHRNFSVPLNIRLDATGSCSIQNICLLSSAIYPMDLNRNN